jgi:hypothetical protein
MCMPLLQLLELLQVEPLELVDGRWRPDTIGVGAYPKITDLKVCPLYATIYNKIIRQQRRESCNSLDSGV